ncbi:MAG: dephospho-CoA kinase [Ruminococcus sp.]|nr:dephospho-CoA kinase [Ruminococcus sp.]
MIIGLTGQSGAGKSTVSRKLSLQEGFAVIDCDSIAKEVTADGSLCNELIKKRFPEAVSDKLVLDRRKMAGIVFSDKEKLREYESIIYPFITQRVNDLISLYSSNGYQAIILDAPTLFEAGMDNICDLIIGVTADIDIRKTRIRQRDNISDEMIDKRFSSQRNDDFFKIHCQYIINNSFDKAALDKETTNIISKIRTMVNG